MASLVLGAVGSALGAGFGGTILGLSGAAIGGMIGSSIGSVIDSALVASLSPGQRIEGARLDSLRITSATEGDPSLPAAPRPAVASASSGLSLKIFQHDVVEHDIRHQPLQLRVLFLKLPQAFGV